MNDLSDVSDEEIIKHYSMTTKELFEKRKVKQESDGEYPYIMMYGEVEEIIKELEASIRKEVVENILAKFYEGDWVSVANGFWTNDNIAGYNIAKEEFESFLKLFALSKGIDIK